MSNPCSTIEEELVDDERCACAEPSAAGRVHAHARGEGHGRELRAVPARLLAWCCPVLPSSADVRLTSVSESIHVCKLPFPPRNQPLRYAKVRWKRAASGVFPLFNTFCGRARGHSHSRPCEQKLSTWCSASACFRLLSLRRPPHLRLCASATPAPPPPHHSLCRRHRHRYLPR